MTPLEQIKSLQKQILKRQLKIKAIQDKCEHKNKTTKHDSNTGNYDRIDMYWSIFTCHDCEKSWRSETKYEIG